MEKKNLPLVSVAIITYNQKIFLKACIESILSQDYDRIEIVIADDGSTDGTHELLMDYKKNAPEKFVLRLSTKNSGISVNSNLAHFACSGKYVAWMGGDDLMLPGKLRRQVNFMEMNENCTISYHNLDVFNSETDETIYLMNNPKNSYVGTFKDVVSKGVFNGACATMVRREKVPDAGFDLRIPLASDWLYWMEALCKGGEICYIDEILGRYRRHNNNVTKNQGYEGEIDHLNSCNILLVKYPQHAAPILRRYFEICRSLRLKNRENYKTWLLMSIKYRFNLKAMVQLMIYYFTFGKIRK